MDFGILAVNTLNEFGILGTPDTRIRRPKYGYYWSELDHDFGEATSIGMSAERSDQEYSYKTDFEVWSENKEFGRQMFLMNRPPLKSTHIGTNSTNVKTSQLESTNIEKKHHNPRH